MELIAIGGDCRIDALAEAAAKAGFSCRRIKTPEEMAGLPQWVEAIVLPWPASFTRGSVSQTEISKEHLLQQIPGCRYLLGGKITHDEFPKAEILVDPSKDEELLAYNARLTAEGAVGALLASGNGAVMGKACLVTGFGRIASALVGRLTALEAFVMVCARSEKQMQAAHRMGAHPVELRQIDAAASQADMIINTIPARIFSEVTLKRMKPDVRYIELASKPYGIDPEIAKRLNIRMDILSGLPGRYAPHEAGVALFCSLKRAMDETAKGKENEG